MRSLICQLLLPTSGYVYFKDQVIKKLGQYESGRRSGARLQIEHLLNTLKGEDEDRFEQVFEDKSYLLPIFLEAAEERRRNGIVEIFKTRNTKRKRERASLLNSQAGATLDDGGGSGDDDGDEDDDDGDDENDNDNAEVDDDDDNDDDTMQNVRGREQPLAESIFDDRMADDPADFPSHAMYGHNNNMLENNNQQMMGARDIHTTWREQSHSWV